ncbi:MgtC/SapB family protein [Pseudomonas sp. RP23018S]|uniref:MgtC/SapB family protein n=1 Tax=Pseudomonas sp. RP23018S TaxID=3096037 RepID=UPI002ACA8C47|nr:MgtC/SapB family protein [Pseudomonas sp. RP23018S]MDZ5605439.1 MgtC/SapB family protein [Pseudomonas sp. RP23018S]
MEWNVFLLRVATALFLGALIGAERQLRQRLTGLRTNALVSTGACLFVLMTQAVPGMEAADASRVAAYVVSGIGFLGGGVIMRDGLNVRGLNTAATLWCTAAVGVLCSLGLLLEAALGSLVVLCANILLREVAQRLDRQDVVQASEVEQQFEVRVICRAEDEIQVRSLMLHSLSDPELRLQSLHSEDLLTSERLEVRAQLLGGAQAPLQLERMVSRVSLEKGVTSVRWQVLTQVPPAD